MWLTNLASLKTEWKKVRPPEKLKMAQWARDRLAWNFDEHPWQVGMFEAVESPDVRRSIWQMCAQIAGKTQVGNAVVGYHVDHEPCGVRVLQPDIERAESWMKNKFDPMVKGNACFRNKIATGGRNNVGNTMKHKVFPGGFVSVSGGNTPQGLAGDSAKVCWADEIDRLTKAVAKEGDPLALFWMRGASFSDGIEIESSTPTIKGQSRITEDFDASDKRYWFVDCPHCGTAQHLKWDQVDWGLRGRGTFEEPLYICENRECDSTWTDVQRCEAIRAGRWIATARFTGLAGFHLNGIYMLRKAKRGFKNGLHEMVSKYLEAKKKGTETLKAWINTFLAEASIEGIEIIEAAEINSRNEKYNADIPPGVLVLTAGADMQKDRIEVEIVGHGRWNETWGIQSRVFHGNTRQPTVFKEMGEWLFQSRYFESGTALNVACMLFDSGKFTNDAYTFTDENQFRKVYPCKGSSTVGAPLVTYSQNRRGLVIVGTEAAKMEIYNSLRIIEPGPGFSHFGYKKEPSDLGYDDLFFEQLTAEQMETEWVKGKGRVTRFTNPHQRRNEALDKRVYALAALALLNPNWEALSKNLELTSAKVHPSANESAEAPAKPIQRPQHQGTYHLKKGKGFATRW